MPKRAPVHRPVQGRDKQADRRRGTAAQRGYDGRWQRLRAHKLRANPVCEECERQGRVTPAREVDHIEPFTSRQDPRRLDWDNLQSLCNPCHQRKTHGHTA